MKEKEQEGNQKSSDSNSFIIPAIDIIEGKCVRLEQGDFAKKRIYNENPLEVAKQFEDAGLSRLHLVDLDGAKDGSVKNWKVLEQIAGKTNLIIDFGGGIKTKGDVDILMNSGASMVTIGSLAVKNEELLMEWILHYGAALFLLGADVKDEKIAINGWQEKTEIGIFEFIGNWISKDLNRIFCTDVNLDGLLKGASIDLYKRILEKFPKLYLIASGGVSSMDDIYQLREIGCSGIIIGKAIYEGRLKLSDISKL